LNIHFLTFLVILGSYITPVFARKDTKKVPKNLSINSDSLSTDSLELRAKTRKDLETTIEYSAKDSIVVNLTNNTIYQYQKSEVTYGDINITSHKMENDFSNKTLKAMPGIDTSGKYYDEPVFKEGERTYNATIMTYYFDDKTATVNQVVTHENEGVLHGDSVLMDQKNNMFVKAGKYTTCNLEHPHYYFQLNKTKYTSKGTTVTDRINLVIGDVPTPLIFPFFILPKQGERSSGVIFPSWGERNGRGFFLENGGYYWAVNDYIGAKFQGSIYSLGDWIVRNDISYKKKYRYSGSTQIQLRNQRSNLGEYNEQISNEFQFVWRHTPQAYGGKSLSANINYVTNDFTRSNIALADNTISNLDLNFSTNFRSSINYNFPLRHTPYNGGFALNLSQDIVSGFADMTAPQFNLSSTRIYPFKKKKTGPKSSFTKFIETIGFTHRMNFNNKITNRPQTSDGFSQFDVANFTAQTDTLEFIPSNFPDFFKRGSYGLTHTIPISASAKIGNFQFNPSFNYVDRWHFEKYGFRYSGNDSVFVDTTHGFFRTGEWNASASLTTNIYGMYQFKGKRKTAIRHTLLPSVGFSINPDFSNGKAFVNVQDTDTTIVENVSVFNGSASGSQSTTKSASMTFSLNNTLEMKYKKQKNDGTSDNEYEKIKLLENLSASGSYNMAADSLKLSNINLNARTSIKQGLLGISATGTIQPYAYEIPEGDTTFNNQFRVNKLAISEGQGIGLQSVTLNANIRLSPEMFKSKEDRKSDSLQTRKKENKTSNKNEYVPFNVPWSLNLNYSINSRKTGFLDPVKTKNLSFNATLQPTEKWDISLRASYDFDSKQILNPAIAITRDLHCWIMRFDWVPTGQFQFYRLEIGVKAAMLRDLRIRKTNRFSAFTN